MDAISFAICTFNRSDELSITLQSFIENHRFLLPSDEILIVDNNSSDETKSTAIDFINRFAEIGVNARYCFEPRQGLSAARNKALSEFVNQSIVFFDDDITVSSNTITEYRRALNDYPESFVFGGRIEVDWGGAMPDWYGVDCLPLIDGLVGRYNLGRGDVKYSAQDLLPYGANFGLRKALVRKVGEFDTGLGVNGNEIARGEETDYILRAFDLGFDGTYLGAALVEHRFQTERLNVRYFYRYGIQKGAVLNKAPTPVFWIKMVEQAIKGVYQLAIGHRGRFYQCVINMGIYRGWWRLSRLRLK